MLSKLYSLSLDAPLDQSGQTLLLVEMILPRPAIARRSTLKPVQLNKGRRSMARAPFYESALLKEKVDGPFGLKVSVTRPLKNPELSRIVRELLALGLESATDLAASSLFDHSLLEDILEEAGSQVADRLSDEPLVIASGGLDLHSDTLREGLLEIPLKLTGALRSSAHVPLSDKREQRKSKAKTYPKGTAIGSVTLQVEPS